MSGPRECRGPGLFSSFQDRVDCSRRLAIVLAEQVCVDTQSDVRLGVAKALADRHDVDASIDQLAGVSVPQGVKRHFRHTDTLGVIAPSRADRIGGEWGTINVGKQQIIVLQPSGPEFEWEE